MTLAGLFERQPFRVACEGCGVVFEVEWLPGRGREAVETAERLLREHREGALHSERLGVRVEADSGMPLDQVVLRNGDVLVCAYTSRIA